MARQSAEPSILVTGATGFLGRAVVQQFCEQRVCLRTTGRRSMPPIELPNYRPASLNDREAVEGLVAGVETVIHLAGLTQDPACRAPADEDFFRINTAATELLIRASVDAGCRRFIFVSSVSVYGRQVSPVTERAVCAPSSAYGRSKLAAEQCAAKIANDAGIELAILRMVPVCGEGARGNVDRLMRAIDRRRFVWVGSGTNRKSLIHVEDAAAACVAVARYERLPDSRVYNVSAPACSMREIVAALAVPLGRKVPPLRLPGQLPLRVVGGVSTLPWINTLSQRAYVTLDKWLCDEEYDATLFRNAFAWRSTIELRDTLARQVKYYRHALARCA